MQKMHVVLGTALATAAVAAQAAVPTALSTAYTTASADFYDVFELALPALVIVAGSMLLWKYGKAFIRGL